MSFSNLFHLSYWFSQPKTARGTALFLWVALFGVFFLAGLVLFIIRAKGKDNVKKEIFRRFGNFGLTIGLLGFVLLFFRQERAAFIAWRFWVLIFLIIAVWWLVKLVVYLIKRVPKIQEEKLRREIAEKYLPERK